MNFLPSPTDDQFALIGCVAALVCSFGLMHLSHHLRRMIRKHSNVDGSRVGNSNLVVIPAREESKAASRGKAA